MSRKILTFSNCLDMEANQATVYFGSVEKITVKKVRELLELIRQDYNRISIPSIAQRAGLTKTTLYEYYKEENQDNNVQDGTVNALLTEFGYKISSHGGDIKFAPQKISGNNSGAYGPDVVPRKEYEHLRTEVATLREENEELREQLRQIKTLVARLPAERDHPELREETGETG